MSFTKIRVRTLKLKDWEFFKFVKNAGKSMRINRCEIIFKDKKGEKV